jgi:hypothetical protein
MGSFALFTMISFIAWTVALWFYRDDLISNRTGSKQLDIQPLQGKQSVPSAPPVPKTNSSGYAAAPTTNLDHLPLHHEGSDGDGEVVDVDLEDSHTF